MFGISELFSEGGGGGGGGGWSVLSKIFLQTFRVKYMSCIRHEEN